MKKLYSIITAILITASVFAQAPEKMSYQAVVRDASDALVTNASIGIQISILQGSTIGTAVYVETQTPSTNINGLLSLEIGTGIVVSGDFTAIDWTSNIYFIKTEIDLTGGTTYTITGTSQLMSVPYALHAKTAESITGSITEIDPVFGSSVASGITSGDTTNWNNHTVDTNTQLDAAGITALGFTSGSHTVDTDTNLDLAGVQALGFVTGAHTVNQDISGITTNATAITTIQGEQTTQNTAISLNTAKLTNATHTGDATGATALTVVGINGTSLSSLQTGILKNTTTTGVPSIAVAGDFPTLNQNTTGTSANVTGTIAIANGGTGATTATIAFDALSPLTTAGDIIYGGTAGTGTRLAKGTANQVLSMNAGATAPIWVTSAAATDINGLTDGKSDGKSIYLGLNSGQNYTGNGMSSVGIGEATLFSNVSGFRNVAVGFNSLNKNTNNDNTAIGAQSMQNNVTGTANTAIGILAMNGSAQGQYNTAIGASALSAPDGALTVGNTAIGGLSLGSHSIGSYNVALGFQSGYSNIIGVGNIFLGYQAGYNEAGSNKLYIENSNSATPLIYGEFDTNLVRANGNLEVSGTVKIEGGTPGTGKVLTSDANGLASWATPAAAPATTDALTEGTTNLYYTEARVSTNTSVATNTAKVTNATHTGDVTGSTALTIGNAKVTNAKVATGIDAAKLANGTVSNTELQYINSLSSNAQTQLNAKQATITGAATTITSSNLTANRALISNSSSKVAVSSTITTTELGYLDGATSNIQTQINNNRVTRTAIITDTAGDNNIANLFGISNFTIVLSTNSLVYIKRYVGSASLSATVNSSTGISNYQNIPTTFTAFSGVLDTNNGNTNNIMDIFVSDIDTNGVNRFYHFTLSSFNNSESVFCELIQY